MQDARTISERLAPVIEAAAERIHYAESRRTNYSTMGGVLVAAAITIFTFAWSSIDWLTLRWSATFAAIAMFAVGTATIWLFGRQTNRYPYTPATKTWKWFYRDALSNWTAFKVPWVSYLPGFWKGTGTRIRSQYDVQLPEFKARMHKLTDERENANQDIEQLYSLHINEGYKNLYLSHLRSLFNLGIWVIAIAIVAGAVVGGYFERRELAIRQFVREDAGYSEKVEIKLVVSPLSPQAEFIGLATISNTGTVPIALGDLSARDENDWNLPLSNVIYFDRAEQVPPNTTLTFHFSFEAAEGVAKRIHSLQVGKR
jgi:hypothetical protein